jgi:predicted amidohydrolase YtcJ
MSEKLIYNAKVYLSRGQFAEGVHIKDGKIVSVGDAKSFDVSPRAERIDAEGRLVLPGFYDCHEHLIMAGRQARAIDADKASVEDMIIAGQTAIERNKPPDGAFVMGMGWNDERLGRWPTRHDLDQISKRHAVVLTRRCGHAAALNTLALKRAGIDPAGHNGTVRDKELHAVYGLIPPDSEADKILYAREAAAAARAFGVTSVASNDAQGGDIEQLTRVYSKVFENADSRVRVTLQCAIRDENDLDDYIASGYKTGVTLLPEMLKIGPLKLFADGSLGSRTAWLRTSYADDPGNYGVSLLTQETLNRYVKKANANAMSVAVHAIGDGAVDSVLQAYETAQTDGKNPLRNGILHCQITDLTLLNRMAACDCLALIQPIFLESDRFVAESRVGKALADTSYAWGTMERLGIRTAYGTDCPIETANPFRNIAAAVGRFGYNEKEAVDVAAAVDAYTVGTAYANFDENRVGRIAQGFMADLIIVDRDIFELPPEEIAQAKAVYVTVA